MPRLALTAIVLGIATSATAMERPPVMIVAAKPDMAGSWTPSASNAEAAYQALAAGLARSDLHEANGRTPEVDQRKIARDLSTYRLRVQGQSSPSRQIAIVGACPAASPDVFRDSVIIGGGECVFDAIYDVRSGTITHFAVKGLG